MKNLTLSISKKKTKPSYVRMKLVKNVSKTKYRWLRRDFQKDEIVYQYFGYTYGCITENGIACCFEPNTNPFFELPRDALLKIDE